MTSNRDQLIAVRLTKQEKKQIEDYAKKKEVSVAELMRAAIFSYIDIHDENFVNLDVRDISQNFQKIQDFAKSIYLNVEKINKELF